MLIVSRYFSYILTRDYGFAPNPFNGTCTLATCKPKIRATANVANGLWVQVQQATEEGVI